ncbi:MAG: LruC domain-containing protein [Bacteroidales bacterium]|nr:LruC domain-containing protein [Bacteroidales bacterium]
MPHIPVIKRIFACMVPTLLLAACTPEDAWTEMERTEKHFTDSLGSPVGALQWWRTAVRIHVDVTTDAPVRLWLLSDEEGTLVYDYKELETSGRATMTAPQGYGTQLYLSIFNGAELSTEAISLSGKPEETLSVTLRNGNRHAAASPAGTRKPAGMKSSGIQTAGTPPPSLCGNSISGNPRYYEFNNEEMADYHAIMDISRSNTDAKQQGLDCDYEIYSNGPFYITWVDGYESSQMSRILGYYYHSPDTYQDIVYVDVCETHKWDYIDGLAKVQYQLDTDMTIDGHLFRANEWYDANFDLNDAYGSTYSANMDRIGDNAYNTQVVYNHYSSHISALQGISFEVNVPKGKQIGFYLRSDEESCPEQWSRLKAQGIRPYTDRVGNFKGTCFSVEAWNTDGTHRSFIHRSGHITWIGMEDNLHGGDHDCNDVVFGLVGDLTIAKPGVPPAMENILPWTLAFENPYRGADFDFNDAVVRLEPDYVEETCRVTILAAGNPERMFLHYDGPDGDYNLGELHQLLTGNMNPQCINTQEAIAAVPFAQAPTVPWPREYTMANDAQRFYIEVKHGTCADCADIVSLPDTPGKTLPGAILVAGDWLWPKEKVPIFEAYEAFSDWAKDATRTRFWDWYKSPVPGFHVSY